MNSCKNSNIDKAKHFIKINKLLINTNVKKRKIIDYKLSRYACYLIIENADSRKARVAEAKTYICIKTRERELKDEFTKEINDAGYAGFYNGEKGEDIKRRKKLNQEEDLLKNMDEYELSINLFRISQTEAYIKKNNIQDKENIKKAYYEIGKNLRKSLIEMNETLPENIQNSNKTGCE